MGNHPLNYKTDENFDYWYYVVNKIFDKSPNKEMAQLTFSNMIADMLNMSYSPKGDYKHAMEYFAKQLEIEVNE